MGTERRRSRQTTSPCREPSLTEAVPQPLRDLDTVLAEDSSITLGLIETVEPGRDVIVGERRDAVVQFLG